MIIDRPTPAPQNALVKAGFRSINFCLTEVYINNSWVPARKRSCNCKDPPINVFGCLQRILRHILPRDPVQRSCTQILPREPSRDLIPHRLVERGSCAEMLDRYPVLDLHRGPLSRSCVEPAKVSWRGILQRTLSADPAERV